MKSIKKQFTRTVAFIGFDGVQALDIIGPMEVFATANRFALQGSTKPYDIQIYTYQKRSLATDLGISLFHTADIMKLNRAQHTVIVTAGSEEELRRLSVDLKLLAQLKKIFNNAHRVASVCTGAFVLAATDFLNQKYATTHWRQCDMFSKLYPKVKLQSDAIYTRDGQTYTSAGVTAGIDLCLALVEEDLGHDVSLRVAQELVVYARRSGGQTQFSKGLLSTVTSDHDFAKLFSQITEHPEHFQNCSDLAEAMNVSERQMARLIRKELQMTGRQFLESAYFEKAKMLLTSTSKSVKQIAFLSGFGSVDTLQRVFLKKMNLSPTDYRSRFGISRHHQTIVEGH